MLALAPIYEFLKLGADVGVAFFATRLALLGVPRNYGEFAAMRAKVVSSIVTRFILTPISIALASFVLLMFVLDMLLLAEKIPVPSFPPADTEVGAYLECMRSYSFHEKYPTFEPNPMVDAWRSQDCLNNLDQWQKPASNGKITPALDHRESFALLQKIWAVSESMVFPYWRVFVLIPAFFALTSYPRPSGSALSARLGKLVWQ
jgi:hypothetical protein